MQLCSVVAVVLAIIAMGIGFYYFAVNESIPPGVDRIQVVLLLLAALSGIVTVLLFGWFIVLLIKRRPKAQGRAASDLHNDHR